VGSERACRRHLRHASSNKFPKLAAEAKCASLIMLRHFDENITGGICAPVSLRERRRCEAVTRRGSLFAAQRSAFCYTTLNTLKKMKYANKSSASWPKVGSHQDNHTNPHSHWFGKKVGCHFFENHFVAAYVIERNALEQASLVALNTFRELGERIEA
jgi:hypothetical protein